MESASVVHPADINLAPDGAGRLVLALTLPRYVTKLFVGACRRWPRNALCIGCRWISL
jgi:hypothetical protein